LQIIQKREEQKEKKNSLPSELKGEMNVNTHRKKNKLFYLTEFFFKKKIT